MLYIRAEVLSKVQRKCYSEGGKHGFVDHVAFEAFFPRVRGGGTSRQVRKYATRLVAIIIKVLSILYVHDF